MADRRKEGDSVWASSWSEWIHFDIIIVIEALLKDWEALPIQVKEMDDASKEDKKSWIAKEVISAENSSK